MSSPQPNPNEPISSDLVKNDPTFADIVVEFVLGLSDRIKAMEEAVRTTNFDALRVAAHQLKGSGGGYGYPILTDRAAQLEKHAKAESIDQCSDALAELKNLCSRVVVSSDQ